MCQSKSEASWRAWLGRHVEARQAFDLAIERAPNDAQRAALE